MSLPALLLHQYDTSPFSEKVRKVFAHKRLAWGAVEQPSDHAEAGPGAAHGRLPAHPGAADRRRRVLRHAAHRARARATAPRADDLPRRRRGHRAGVEPVGRSPALHAGGGGRLRRHRAVRAEGLHGRPREDDAGAQLRRCSQARHPRARAGARAARDRRGAALRTDARGSSARRSAWRTPPATIRCGFSVSAPAARRCWRSSRASAPGWRRSRRWARASAATSRRQTRSRVARDTEPAASGGVDPREPNGLAAGMEVTVTPDDYGFDPVAGTLVASSVDEVAIRRSEPGARRGRGALPALRVPRRAASSRSRLAALQGHGV